MEARVAWDRTQYANMVKRDGVRLTLRHVTRTGGPTGLANPATVVGAVIDGLHEVGAPALALRGTTLRGRFLAGDMIQIGSVLAAVAAPGASDDGRNRITLPLQTGLTAPLADGIAVSAFFWGADRRTWGIVRSFPTRLIDGQNILASDQQVTLAARHCPVPPTVNDQVLIGWNGGPPEAWRIMDVEPVRSGLTDVAYYVQARR
jgi:hypothetical protein